MEFITIKLEITLLFVQVHHRLKYLIDLIYIRYIPTIPFNPTDIREFNGSLYVGTTLGMILVLNNETVTSHFNTICNFNSTYGKSISLLEIDSFGQIAILYSSHIYLYSISGTYLNISWVSPIQNATSIGFDGLGNFILTAYSGIYVFN